MLLKMLKNIQVITQRNSSQNNTRPPKTFLFSALKHT